MSARARADAFKDKGNKAYGAGNYSEAIGFYTQAIEIDGRNHVYFSNRSAAYLAMGKNNEALSDAEKCHQLNPAWPKGFFRVGSALRALGRFSEAEAILREGLTKDPSNQDLQRTLSEITHEREEAEKFLGPDGRPLTGAALEKARGNDHFKNGRFEQAIECYQKGVTMTSDPIERSVLYSNLAACWSQQQNWQMMLEAASNAVKDDPKNVKALMRRGLAYEGLEKYKLAMADMKAVLELDPTARTASAAIARLSRFINY